MSRLARVGVRAPAGGWCARCPGPVAAALFDAGADRAAARARRPGRASGWPRTCAAWSGPACPRTSWTNWYGRDCARTPGTGWRPSGCRRCHAPTSCAGSGCDRGHLLAEDVAAGRGGGRAAARRQLGRSPGAWVTAMGWPLTTVAERLKPGGVYERFLRFRRGLGMEIMPPSGGDRPPMDVLDEALGKGHVVPLLADRDLSARGRGGASSSAGGPGCRPGRRCSRCAPARRCTWPPVVRAESHGRCWAAAAAGPERAARRAGTGDDPADRRPLRRGHRGTPGGLAHAAAAVARRVAEGTAAPAAGDVGDAAGRRRTVRPDRPEGRASVRIGIVCPYSFDVPGGVQNHVHDLAETLIGLGHEVSVLAPADEDRRCRRTWCRPAGRCRCRYNGSVARLSFGPISAARVRRWLDARAISTCCTCTSRSTPEPVDACGALRPGGRWWPPSTPR